MVPVATPLVVKSPPPPPNKLPQLIKVCPSNRPVGTYPNCCPQGTSFQRGKCRAPVNAAPPSCPSDRPVGAYPNCCPEGTTFARGKCRAPVQAAPLSCPSDRPVGAYPNCCPEGYQFARGKCRPVQQNQPDNGGTSQVHDCPPGYKVLSAPNKYGAFCEAPPDANRCPSDRPNGTPPNCCPDGTVFREGFCRPEKCSPGWTGLPPHCEPPAQAPAPVGPAPRCKPPLVGTPPNCACPSGQELFKGECTDIVH